MEMSLPIRTTGCKLCLHQNIAKYEDDYIHKRKTAAEIVELLNAEGVKCSRSTFLNHIKYHLQPEVAVMFSQTAPAIVNEIVDKVGELVDEIDRIKDKINKLTVSIGTEPAMIRAYTGLEAELRKAVETLARVQGELRGSEHIHIKSLNIEYTQVAAQILQDVCPACKTKLLKTLEPIIVKKNA